jgi:hypothetical protein
MSPFQWCIPMVELNLVPIFLSSPTPPADGRRRFAGSSTTSASGPTLMPHSNGMSKSATICTQDESLAANARG